MKNFMLTWGLLILSVWFNVFGVFVVKGKLNELGPMPFHALKPLFHYMLDMAKSPFVLIGIILFFLAPFLFAAALSRMEIVVAYPAQIGLNFLFVLLLAVIFLGEQLSIIKIIGMCLVFVGVYLLNKGGISG